MSQPIQRRPTHLLNPNALGAIQTRLHPPLTALVLPAQDAYNDVARLRVRALVALALKHELTALGNAHGEIERVVLHVRNEHVEHVWMCESSGAEEVITEDLFVNHELDTESQDHEKWR
ncbi:hypothetical protein JB92DRAFT_3116845 [Gautieria morchelliformis]|nr:hypothetical protein JB92DRAFT_3116845 [Gautieria morchelliformis]